MTVTILVVDDEPDVAELFRRRFRKEIRTGEYELVFSESGEDAIETLRGRLQPEVMLILSDINMPGMSGFELLTHVRDQWPNLPTAMITAYGDDERRKQAEELGAVDFLTKPLDFDVLKEKIQWFLKRK